MVDQDFLKTLTILYIEDDKNTSKSFYDILNKLFNEVILVEDGLSGLDTFKDSLDSELTIDAIISDIKLPKLNGLDLLEEIRKYDENVPFIFTTGYYEADYLLKAIKFGVTEFYVKPLNAKEIITHIQKVCEKRYQESRINKHNKYKFVNEFFCEVSGYQEDEIIGEHTSIVKPEDVSGSIYEELWDELHKGNVWRGKLKHKAKDGTAFFVTSTIFPIFDEKDKTKLEYISIEFITT